ncbi:MAG: hypothetical protein H0T81_10135, partial [Sphingomonas sp.]|nr:hypothetical protein [Sphingomonas sp.]
MRAGLRFGIAAIAAGLALAGTPALAQNTTAPATNTPSETIGPRELEGFSLNGTVTRPAPAAPSRTAPEPRPAPVTTRAPQTGPTPAPRASPVPRDTPRAPSVAEAGPPADPLSAPPTPAPGDFGSGFEAQPGFSPTPTPAPTPIEDVASDRQGDLMPWLLALILLGAGAGYY